MEGSALPETLKTAALALGLAVTQPCKLKTGLDQDTRMERVQLVCFGAQKSCRAKKAYRKPLLSCQLHNTWSASEVEFRPSPSLPYDTWLPGDKDSPLKL